MRGNDKMITYSYDKNEDILYISIGEKRRAHAIETEPGFIVRHSIVEDKIVGITLIDFTMFKISKIEDLLKMNKVEKSEIAQILKICESVNSPYYTLSELLENVNNSNLHKEFNFGKDVGSEFIE